MALIDVQLQINDGIRYVESKKNELEVLYDSVTISDPDIETRIKNCKIALTSAASHYRHFNSFLKLSGDKYNEDLITKVYLLILECMNDILEELEILKQKILKHEGSEKS